MARPLPTQKHSTFSYKPKTGHNQASVREVACAGGEHPRPPHWGPKAHHAAMPKPSGWTQPRDKYEHEQDEGKGKGKGGGETTTTTPPADLESDIRNNHTPGAAITMSYAGRRITHQTNTQRYRIAKLVGGGSGHRHPQRDGQRARDVCG